MKPELKGDCVQCGLCCFMDGYRCVNLVVSGEPGRPMATKCGAYSVRYMDMPIVMINKDGAMIDAYCGHGREEEPELIIARGFGKGCSLTLKEPEKWQISLIPMSDAKPRKHWSLLGWLRERGSRDIRPAT